jgi:hypothetical protein
LNHARQRGLPLWLIFRTERSAPRDQAADIEADSAVSATAVTEASAMTEATMGEANMGEAAMVKSAVVKSAVVKSVVKAAAEAKDANEPRVVETIRIVIGIGIPIRVPVGVGITVRVGKRISRGLRLHGVATRRHALQVAVLVEGLLPAVVLAAIGVPPAVPFRDAPFAASPGVPAGEPAAADPVGPP